MADKNKRMNQDPDGTTDPQAPKPEKDDQALRDSNRPMHPNERENRKQG
jgi:hypothetical protein